MSLASKLLKIRSKWCIYIIEKVIAIIFIKHKNSISSVLLEVEISSKINIIMYTKELSSLQNITLT